MHAVENVMSTVSHTELSDNSFENAYLLNPNEIHVWTSGNFNPKNTPFKTKMRSEILSLYTKIQPKNLDFSKNKNGKPFLKNSPLNFNISHSKRHMVIAISHNPIGIDTEFKKEARYIQIAERFFSKEESSFLKTLTNTIHLKSHFYSIWTQKEAYSKAKGDKLISHLNSQINTLPTWHFETLKLRHRYQTTIAYTNKSRKIIKIFDYDSFLKS